jgi:hypothetical protein
MGQVRLNCNRRGKVSYQITPFDSDDRFRGTFSYDIIGYSVGAADAKGAYSAVVNQAKDCRFGDSPILGHAFYCPEFRHCFFLFRS